MDRVNRNYHTAMKSEPAKPTQEAPDLPAVDTVSSAGPPGLVDTSKFVEAGEVRAGVACTDDLERLDSALDGRAGLVRWRFAGRLERTADGGSQRWLNLSANLNAQMTCARCDEPADIEVSIERDFLLVADERKAQLLDDEAEDYDVLVGARRFSLTDLLEDEFLMALPTFVSHESCQPVQIEQADEPARNPFAALGKLRIEGK